MGTISSYHGEVQMPRVEANVTATFRSGTDVGRIGRAISEALKSMTGNDVQVVVNSRGKTPGRVGIWEMQMGMKPGNIELRSKL